MSKHRIKSIALDDDYEDDDDNIYGEEEANYTKEDVATAEEKEKLRIGTIQVHTALGPEFSAITDQEIQDTLWHYFYDVAKSVAYLKNKHTSKQGKALNTRPEKAARQEQVSRILQASKLLSSYNLAPHTAKSFFQDCPWLNVPSHRRAEILVKPVLPRFGLLGGSSAGEGKMSKLAALAAKRRQKENEKRQDPAADTETVVGDSVSSLRKLRDTTRNDSDSPKGRSLQQLQDFGFSSPREHSQRRDSLKHILSSPKQEENNRRSEDVDAREQCQFEEDLADLRAKPSSFAQTLTECQDQASFIPLESSTFPTGPLVSPFDFTKPSPDDVVLKAQNFKGSKTTTPVQQQKMSSAKESTSSGMKQLSIREPVKIKAKNLDVLAEYSKIKRKNAANFVVIGHVDSGKSTLMGRLLFDLKAIDDRTMNRYKKEAEKMGKGSFAFAWILDQGLEERARGVTIDIATNKFETDQTAFTILDAPGHRDFVPNMIAGASQADFAVLVVDASPGEFEAGLRGQTKEHALLVRSMGVSKMVVAVNKMDRNGWSQERFQDIQQQMLAFLTTAGFKRENLSFVPCSGLHGDNILSRSTDQRANWYSGQSLVEELDISEPINHALDKPLRMTIGDIFQESGQNTLSVSGRIEAGSLQGGDQIMVMPSGEKAAIKSIQVDDEPNDWAVAGQNVVLNITDFDHAHVRVGDMLCSPDSPIRNVSSFTAKVLAFEHLMPMPLDIHRGRLHVAGKISKLVAVLDKTNGGVVKDKPKIAKPGAVARVVVELDVPAPIEGGRIVFRSDGETAAAGLVE